MNRSIMRRVTWFRPPAFFALILILITNGLAVLPADIRVTEEPASEGRPITPAGSLVLDAQTGLPAVGSLPVDFVRSPDHTGRDGGGRYLLVVNSGFGIQFSSETNRAQQSIAVLDLDARPAPMVIQNVYFPEPQSVNVGLCFSPRMEADASYTLYASGGFENKVWLFRFHPGASTPVTPPSPGPDTKVTAPFIDVSGLAAPVIRHYNKKQAPLYPTGIAISPDGNTLFVANNLGDSLGVISDLRGARRLERVALRGSGEGPRAGRESFVFPYGVVALQSPNGEPRSSASSPASASAIRVFVSCWNDASLAVVDFAGGRKRVSYVHVGRHPTAMILNRAGSRLYVVNSNADSVSVIDTTAAREVERINVRLAEQAPVGSSPEGLALSGDEETLYVANAHSNAVAVVALSPPSTGSASGRQSEADYHVRPGSTESRNIEAAEADDARDAGRSVVRGFIPTGQYPSALAVADGTIFVGNGKGTGFRNSSMVVDNSGRVPNTANERFPPGTGRGVKAGGQYSVSLVAGNISAVTEPDERSLVRYTQQVMRNDGLLGREGKEIFTGKPPFKHLIYIIKENRTYDQVFGDLETSGDGSRADGDAALAIFGAGEAARVRGSATAQEITPNQHALALRFGLLDRYFANSEASADGHNWCTAAFSNDYVDKAFRWHYSERGRTYDFEGFNRLPDVDPLKDEPPFFTGPVKATDLADFIRRFIPYLNGARDAAEPETLYLWDAAARAGLTYRNYGEFVGTISAADVAAVNANRTKSYPDLSPTVSSVPTKKSLEGHHSDSFRNFDLRTPDAMTIESYRAAKGAQDSIDPAITRASASERFRGTSRLGSWLEEFDGFVADREGGKPDRMPNLSILRLSSDHTDGLAAGMPTPQFLVADNDYAVGRLVEAVSNSPYWKDTAIFITEDDAQDGPDHVDAHRSVALVISAYNRPGALVHEFHNTVSLVRTMEVILGIAPMNQLDASATPIDIFRAEADLRPFQASLPTLAFDNLMNRPAHDAETAYWIRQTAEQDLTHADMARPDVLNRIIWFSVRGGGAPMPKLARLPAFDAMLTGINREKDTLAVVKGPRPADEP